MGRWRAFLTLSNIARFHRLSSNNLNNNNSCHLNALLRPWLASNSAKTQFFTSSRGFSAASPFYAAEEIDYQGPHDFVDEHHEEDAEAGKIPIKSYFLCTRFPFVTPYYPSASIMYLYLLYLLQCSKSRLALGLVVAHLRAINGCILFRNRSLIASQT